MHGRSYYRRPYAIKNQRGSRMIMNSDLISDHECSTLRARLMPGLPCCTVFNCGNYIVDYDKRSLCLEEQLNNGCNYHTYEERLVVAVVEPCSL